MAWPVLPRAPATLEAARRADPVVAGILDGSRAFAGPEHVVVDLTNRCNYTCAACWTFSPLLGDKRPPAAWFRQELPGPLVGRLLDDLAALGARQVRFTGGGEPFLHPEILPLVARCAALGVRADVTTNGSRLDRDTARFLVRSGMGELSVSLWAADGPSFAATHPGQKPEAFERLVDDLHYLAGIRGRRLELVLLNVIGATNHDRVAAMFELALELGADRVYFTLVDPIPGATDRLLLTADQRRNVLEQVGWIERRLAELRPGRIGIDFLEGFKARLAAEQASEGRYDAAAVEAIPCYIGWYFCRITAAGDVCPCCRGVSLPLGNLHRQGFRDIWEGEAYARFRSLALTRSKRDPYFASVGCHQMCDNLMHNQSLDRRVRGFLSATPA